MVIDMVQTDVIEFVGVLQPRAVVPDIGQDGFSGLLYGHRHFRDIGIFLGYAACYTGINSLHIRDRRGTGNRPPEGQFFSQHIRVNGFEPVAVLAAHGRREGDGSVSCDNACPILQEPDIGVFAGAGGRALDRPGKALAVHAVGGIHFFKGKCKSSLSSLSIHIGIIFKINGFRVIGGIVRDPGIDHFVLVILGMAVFIIKDVPVVAGDRLIQREGGTGKDLLFRPFQHVFEDRDLCMVVEQLVLLQFLRILHHDIHGLRFYKAPGDGNLFQDVVPLRQSFHVERERPGGPGHFLILRRAGPAVGGLQAVWGIRSLFQPVALGRGSIKDIPRRVECQLCTGKLRVGVVGGPVLGLANNGVTTFFIFCRHI